MKRVPLAVGGIAIAIGLPLVLYYGNFFLGYNNTISPAFPPDVLFRFQMALVFGGLLVILGMALIALNMKRPQRFHNASRPPQR